MLKLDLHGIRHTDVPRIVEQFLNDHWMCGELAEIITGNSNRMKTLVAASLDLYDIPYKTSDILGHIVVYFEGE